MPHAAAEQLRAKVPPRLFAALDRGDVGVFLRFWAALPPSGRPFHPLSAFVYAALVELGEQQMTGAQRYATDQRLAALYREALELPHR